MLLWRRPSVFNGVITAHVKESWESLLTFLARVRSIPTVVHVGVQAIVKTTLFVLDIDRLRRPVHAVGILRFKQKDTEVRIFTHVRIPFVLFAATWDDLSGSGLEIVRRNLVDAGQAKCSWNALILHLIHLDEHVVEPGAREISTVFIVGPAWIW